MGAEQTDEKPIMEKPLEDMTPDERKAFLKSVRETNKAMVDELLRIPGLPPLSLGAQRIEAFIEFMLPSEDGTNEERALFEIMWELRANRLVARLLTDIESQMNRAKLTGGVGVPVPPPPGGQGPHLVVPGS